VAYKNNSEKIDKKNYMRVETENTILEEYKILAITETINMKLLFVKKREKLINNTFA